MYVYTYLITTKPHYNEYVGSSNGIRYVGCNMYNEFQRANYISRYNAAS